MKRRAITTPFSFCRFRCLDIINSGVSEKMIIFVVAIRRENPKAEGIHCLSVMLNSGKI